jgi:glucosamine 6-phosphate synthetase-like amidotransferase/phosphosugar isomerase protein
MICSSVNRDRFIRPSLRWGGLYLRLEEFQGVTSIAVPQCAPFVAPLLYAIPVQLLAYHTAVLKGTDVDQPRNLAKSVTVE